MTTSTSAAYTKGPWKITGLYGNNATEIVAHHRSICRVTTHKAATGPEAEKFTSVPFAEGEANLRLIAAAPELYEALRVCLALIEAEHGNVSTGEVESEYRDEVTAARAALAKAEGK